VTDPLDACITVATGESGAWRFGEQLIVSPRVTVVGADGGNPRTLRETFIWLRQRQLRAAVLRGPVGSGKAILLDLLMQKVMREGSESLGLPAELVPVLLRLQRLELPSPDLADFIMSNHPSVDPQLVRELCQYGRSLLCFDGLGAFSEPEPRARAFAWLEQVRVELPDSYLVVTSAPGPEHEATPGFAELRTYPFDAARIRAFVRGSTEHEAKHEANELLALLDSPACSADELLARLARRPLWLGLICSLHGEGKLSGARGRHLLLRQCLDASILHGRRHRHISRRYHSMLDIAAVVVVKELALWMHERGRRWVAEAEVRGFIEERVFVLPQIRVSGRAPRRTFYKPNLLLAMLCDELGLLIREGDQLGFVDVGFQEYFAAERLRDETEMLVARFDDSWWQEVIVLVLVRAVPSFLESFSAALLEHPAFPDWARTPMMQRCLDAAGDELLVQMAHTSACNESLGELQQLALTRVLSRVEHLPTSVERLLDNHPSSVVREWWAERRREADPPK
jgi:predicted NACHT family NTPase